MFIFHEGLPRSGKSYEALVQQIIPALKKGRKVFAYINGLDHAKIAEVLEMEVDQVKSLLVQIEKEQVHEVYKHIENDALVVLDEMQNFWPTTRGAMSKEMTTFITEHGHKGLDIVGMGQAITDVNAIWRRRCDQKIQFTKLSHVGKDHMYQWVAYKGLLNGKGDITFAEVSRGKKEYDKKYFGTYKSHEDATTNYDNKSDERLNIYNTKLFKVFIPLFAIFLICSICYLVWFFMYGFDVDDKEAEIKGEPKKLETVENKQVNTISVPANQFHSVASKQSPKPKPKPKLKRDDFAYFIIENNEKFRPRLAYKDSYRGFVHGALIVWESDDNAVKDQIHLEELKDLGFKIRDRESGIVIIKDDYKHYYRFKPDFEMFGRLSENRREQVTLAGQVES